MDKRTSNPGRPKIVVGDLKEQLKEHLKFYERSRSHYTNADNEKDFEYVYDSSLTIAKFWRDFLEIHDAPFFDEKKGRWGALITFYSQTFNFSMMIVIQWI